MPEDHGLGGGHIAVTGADDLVHARDGLGAIGQRRDRLRPADGEDPVDPGDPGGAEDDGLDLTPGRRDGHDHLADPGDLGRDDVHEHGRRIGRLAPRDIDPDPLQGRHPLAEEIAGALGQNAKRDAPGLDPLVLVIAPDARRGRQEGFAEARIAVVHGRREPLARQLQRGGRSDLVAVETPGVFTERRIAALADGGDDLPDRGQHGRIGGVLMGDEGSEPLGKPRIAGVQSEN